ncbi:MAG: 3'(2'),5'-bisphosphate nucleotidase CysQ [Alphaproteobacteria bacterium]|nr:3'(2'),5'-bisphosphate nucleotidase CysQ [Alphaproteobacteria bacterium]
MSHPAQDRHDDLELLLTAVREAGAIALGYFRGPVDSWDKSPGDPVSEADHAVDDFLRERLTTARPDYGWLSEETRDDRKRLDSRRVFVVDPIDGTRAFLRREPEFTIAAALVEDGRPVAAAVYNPATEEMFEATLGGGARRNDEPIAVSAQGSFSGARLLSGKRMFERAGWKEPPADAEFRSINSIAYRMALVASGRYDACVSLAEKSDWDIAAADLIVGEAGGRVTTARGKALCYNARQPRHPSVLVAGPALHGVLIDFLKTVQRPPGAGW